jgi:hypothetical protein
VNLHFDRTANRRVCLGLRTSRRSPRDAEPRCRWDARDPQALDADGERRMTAMSATGDMTLPSESSETAQSNGRLVHCPDDPKVLLTTNRWEPQCLEVEIRVERHQRWRAMPHLQAACDGQ